MFSLYGMLGSLCLYFVHLSWHTQDRAICYNVIIFYSTFTTLDIGLAITIYVRCIYNIFGMECTKYKVTHGVYLQPWPTQIIYPPALLLR